MMDSKNVCVITGSRADYGHLYALMRALKLSDKVRLQIVATGTHFLPEFGNTVAQIVADGFEITEKVEISKVSDDAIGISETLGHELLGIAKALPRLSPRLLVLFGDRFEMLAAAQAALLQKIPVLHIGGGDTTEGAYDESIRHCLTKLSHIHCVTSFSSKERVLQLGENPEHVHLVGSLGLEVATNTPVIGRSELEAALGVTFREKILLVTYHPTTLGEAAAVTEVSILLRALSRLGPDVSVIITAPNLDAQCLGVKAALDEFAARNDNTRVYQALGHKLYLNLIRAADVVVGNSSSGLYEAPFLKTPSVNIGDRQKGRLSATSVSHCDFDEAKITQAIQAAYDLDCSETLSLYGDGNSSAKIVELIERFLLHPIPFAKSFFSYGEKR